MSNDTALRLAIEYLRVDQWCTHGVESKDAAHTAIRCCATRLHVYPEFNNAVERLSNGACTVGEPGTMMLVDEVHITPETIAAGDLDQGAPNHTDHSKRGFTPK